MDDYYKILNIDKNASNDEIKAAYRKLARENHPDKGGNNEQFIKIQEAYEILSDPNHPNHPNNIKKSNIHTSSHFTHDFFTNTFFNMTQKKISKKNCIKIRRKKLQKMRHLFCWRKSRKKCKKNEKNCEGRFPSLNSASAATFAHMLPLCAKV